MHRGRSMAEQDAVVSFDLVYVPMRVARLQRVNRQESAED